MAYSLARFNPSKLFFMELLREKPQFCDLINSVLFYFLSGFLIIAKKIIRFILFCEPHLQHTFNWLLLDTIQWKKNIPNFCQNKRHFSIFYTAWAERYKQMGTTPIEQH